MLQLYFFARCFGAFLTAAVARMASWQGFVLQYQAGPTLPRAVLRSGCSEAGCWKPQCWQVGCSQAWHAVEASPFVCFRNIWDSLTT